jgi:anti-sigma factor RsiW
LVFISLKDGFLEGRGEVKMACREVQDKLSAWLDRELAPEAHDAVAAHLEGCAGCRRELARLRALEAALGELHAPEPTRVAEKVLDRLQASRGRRSRSGWQSLALAASLVLGIILGGSLARDFYPSPASENGGAEVAALQDFHDFPQGSLGTILASYQPEEGNGS